MKISQLSGAVCGVVFTVVSTLTNAVTIIDYELGGGWTYEVDFPSTVTLSDNPASGVTAVMDVPNGIDGGGITASRHDLSGFSLSDGVFIELEYNSLSLAVGTDAVSGLNLEIEFFDSASSMYEIGMNLSGTGGELSFETWFDKDGADNPMFASIPSGLDINQGALGLQVTGTTVIPYFKDAGGNLTTPFTAWNISMINGAHSFSVDNDFEGDTSLGGFVNGSVNLERVVYGVSAVPVPAAVWLFGSGLLGLVGMARRKKA